MYRLLKIASTKNLRFSNPLHPCFLCSRARVYLSNENAILTNTQFSRNFSTKDLENLQEKMNKKKRKLKSKKKYSELVEVNKGASKLTGAVIRNLKAKDVKQLTEQPELTLEQFHHLFDKGASKLFETTLVTDESARLKACTAPFSDNSDYLLSKMNLSLVNDDALKQRSEEENDWDLIERDTEVIDMYSNVDSRFSDNGPLIESLLEKHSKTTPVSGPTKKKTKRQKKLSTTEPGEDGLAEELVQLQQSVHFEQHTNLSKFERFNKHLTSYIELCVQCDLLNLALSSLNRYIRIQSFNQKLYKVTSAEPFDSLLQGFASKANMEKILTIMRLMSNNDIDFTPQTFAACFECCARLPQCDEITNRLKMVEVQLKSRGFNFNDLLTRCTFVRNQRDYVLKSIKQLDPEFTPQFPPQDKGYLQPVLETLNTSNRVFKSPAATLITDEQMNKSVDEQINVELRFEEKVKSVAAPKEITPEIERSRKKWNDLINSWRTCVKNSFIKRLDILESQLKHTKKCHSMNLYPYLKVLTPDQYVDVVMHEVHKIITGSESFSPVLKSLRRNVGRQVKLRYDMKMKEQSGVLAKMTKIYKDYCKWYLNPEINTDSYITRHQWQTLCDEMMVSGPTIDECQKYWPPTILYDIGKFLYDIILMDLKTEIEGPWSKKSPRCQHSAFHRIFRYQGQCLIEEVKPSPAAHSLYKASQQEDLHFEINMLPTLSPPIPWTSPHSGGYICTKVNFVRIEYSPRNPALTAPCQNMYPVFDSLNQLSSVPWKINEPVLDVMLKVFQSGGSKKLNVPLSAEAFMKAEQEDNPLQEYTSREHFIMFRRKSETYSLWCDSLYRLSLANHYRKRIFWFPHNLDFRGRVYPVPPHLTHLGSDLARCLLMFAKGEKLGPKGLDWLKIHCINLTGLKKKHSSSARLEFANEILPKILDSAEKPLTGEMWWAESDEMWQTLASCMEIKAALDSGDPENYVCHFPIHQDGSCNGLQHYAALGRDESGGKSVNLTPCSSPQDVYSCVVKLVEEQRKRDAKTGSEVARALDGYVKRKVIKQTIMTTVYGVTKYGGRLQIAKQLKDVEGFPEKLVWNGSMYLVSTTFVCLRDMFSSAKQIQDWLTECAKFISGNSNEFVEWETPLGLPVLQPYCKGKTVKVFDKSNKSKKEEPTTVLKTLVPIKMKQKNAFPPNFVHSLDSSHMMLTSLFCEREGITYVSVHDCFWTHPSSVSIMNKICREQFVKLHSLPLLEDLSISFVRRYLRGLPVNKSQGLIFLQVPKQGNLNLEDVLRSEYFFS